MRKAFIKTLTTEAGKNNNIILITADLGFSVFEDFMTKFPNQFMNIGVAEGNMVGVAAGLALCDKIVFTYSIGTFMTMRAYEQIRNDVAVQNVNVKIVGVGGGFPYGVHGVTHHAIEDIAIMRVLPHMTVICPADPIETELAVKGVIMHNGPVYLRLGKGGDPTIHQSTPQFRIGRGIVVKDGNDAVIISTGNQVYNSLSASIILEKKGYSVAVISMHTIKPLDTAIIIGFAKKTGVLATVEEHQVSGGLGGAVAEVLIENGFQGIRFKRLGINESMHHIVGNQQYLREKHSISIEQIAAQVETLIKK